MDQRKGQVNVGILLLLLFLCAVLLLHFFHVPVPQPLLVALALFIFVISFLNLDLALIILILSMLLSPEIQAGGISGRSVVVRSEDIFILVVSLGWLARLAVNKELGLIRKTALNMPIQAYFTICLVASGVSIIQGIIEPRNSFFYLLKYLEYFLLYFMVANNLRNKEQAKRFVFFLLLTCGVVCLYALAAGGDRMSAPFEGKGGEPNTLAAYLMMMISVGLGLLLYAESFRKTVVLAVFLCLCFVVLMWTLSRGGWLAMVLAMLYFVFFNRRHRHFVVLGLAAFAVSLPLVAPEKVRERFRDVFSPERSYSVMGREVGVSESTAARIDSWGIGFQRWVRRPVLGYGVPSGNVIDNQYMRVLTETGVIGSFAFLWIIVTVFAVSRRGFFSGRSGFEKGLALGLGAGLAGLLGHSVSAATFILIRVMEPFWFLAAIVAVMPDLPDETESETEKKANA